MGDDPSDCIDDAFLSIQDTIYCLFIGLQGPLRGSWLITRSLFFSFIYKFMINLQQLYLSTTMYLLRPFRYCFSLRRQWLYMIPHKVRDVIKIHDIKQNPYVMIDGNRLNLPRDTYIGNVRVPKVNNFLKFYDMHFNYFYNSTAVARVIDSSFFIQVQEDMYFVVSHDRILKEPESPVFDPTQANTILEPIVGQTLRELQGTETIQRGAFFNHLMKNVMDCGLSLKYDKIMFKQLLKIVDKKIDTIEESIHKAEEKLLLASKKRAKWFTNFIIAELAILHYFIYFNLSWDIMEPITVLLANVDIMVAYWFFILKGKAFSPEGWHKEIFNRKKYRYLTKAGIDIEKYEQYIQIRENLQLRLGLLTRNPQILLQTVQKPFKLLGLK